MVIKWDVKVTAIRGDEPRRAYIWLPDYYYEDDVRRYPVLYMFDGHNVFFDADATYGKSWGMASYMTLSRKGLIIVAVECNHKGNNRLREYSPVNFKNDYLGSIHGCGKKYMDWLVNELKPYVDENFRTLSDREHTAICGSSMGGLMSLYAAAAYNDVFRKAACLSPSLWVNADKVMALVKQADVKPDTVIYMDYGSEEMSNHEDNIRALTKMNSLLLTKGVNLTFRIVPGGNHSEASWEKQIPIFMDCLGL